MSIQHEYVSSNNPRLAGLCACGHTAFEHPARAPSMRRRDLASEREITANAARGAVDPTPLIDFSEARAAKLSGKYVPDPSFVQLRDRLRDAKEELADCRAYLTWFIEENAGAEKAHDAFLALRHILLAYDLLCRED